MLDWTRFERLIVDLFQEEDGISYCELHGTPGPQTDFGVDVIAMRTDGDGVEVASCKRYPDVTAAKLAAWSDEMLVHWKARWSKKGVRRFVLATSARNIARIDVQDQVAIEVERFAALGVRYEIWGPTQLVRKLRPHRLLTAGYLKEHWADAICGAAAIPASPVSASSSMITSGAVAQLAELQELLSGEVSKRIDNALSELREGRYGAVKAFAAEMHMPDHWSQLTAEVQATVLRLEGSLALSEDDIETAQAKSDLADACHPQDEPRLVARIIAERSGARAGATALGKPESIAGRQLQAALLLSAGEHRDARHVLLALDEQAPNDPETLRLLALERLGANQRQEAFALIQRVEALAGGWLATLRNGVIIRYSLALSPSLGPEWLLVPNPIDIDLVLSDEVAQGYLVTALQRLESIPDTARSDDDRLWRLAILANMRGRHADAMQLAAELLEVRPGDPMIVAWTLMRGYDLDLEQSRLALMAAYERGADEPTVKVLAMTLARAGDHEAGADFLAAHLVHQEGTAAEEARFCISRLRGQPADSTAEALRKAQVDGDWDDAEALLVKSLTSDPPHPLALSIAELAASEGRFRTLSEHLDRLVAFGTAGAIRLAIYAAINCGDHQRALDLLAEHAGAFGAALPADLQRLRAEALTRAGDLRGALDAATRLASDGGLPDKLFEAEIRARLGSISQSVPLVRRALSEGVLTSTVALQWSQVLRREAPDLARDLMRSALASGIEDAYVLAAFGQSVDLGLGELGNGLMPRIAQKAERGDPEIRSLKIDEAQQFIKDLVENDERISALYRAGAIPEHLFARGRGETLLRTHCGANRRGQPGELEPRLIRHGARPLDFTVSFPWAQWRIHLDVTGLLEAQRFGLLDRLESHPNGLTISPHLPGVLLEMRLSGPQVSAAHVDMLRRGLADVEAGFVEVVDWFGPSEPVVEIEHDQDQTGPILSEMLGPLVSANILTRHEAASLVGSDEALIGANMEAPATMALSVRTFVTVAAAGLLQRLSSGVRLRVESGTVATIRGDILRVEADAELSAIATALSQRVGDGIAAGVYHLLPVGHSDQDETKFKGTQLERQLGDLLSVAPTDGAVVWFDDRNLSGYIHAGTLPIIGLIEVVRAMAVAGELKAAEARQICSALRASGAFFPFEVEEIVEPLLRAPVVKGKLIETDTLRDLRRAFAAIRTMEPDIKIGPMPELLQDRPDEDLIARSTVSLFSESLALIWTAAEGSVAERMARSDWLLWVVRIHRMNRVPAASDLAAARQQFEVLEISHCLDKASDIGRDRSRRDHYLHWCWQRLVVPRLKGRPSIVDAIGDYLAGFYRALLRDDLPASASDRLLYERLLFVRVQRLPDPIADRIRGAGVFARLVKLSSTITIQSRGIEASRFWRAVRVAIRYGSARARTSTGRLVRVRWTGKDLLFHGRGIRAKINAEIPQVVAARAAEQVQALTTFVQHADLSDDDAAKMIEAVTRSREPEKIAAILDKARAMSVANRRRQVAVSFASRRGAELRDLEPSSVRQMAWHYRIDPETGAIDDSWVRLKDRHGVVAAYLMLAAYPSALPTADEVDDASIDEIIASARTPMALAAAGGLARRRARPDDQLALIATRFLAAVADAGDLFCSILSWAWMRWHQDEDCSTAPASLTLPLAWLHADWLTGAFQHDGFDLSALQDSFVIDPTDLDPLTRTALSPAGYLDQADPAATSKAVILYHGLAEILGDLDASEILTRDDLERANEMLLVNGPPHLPVSDLIIRRPDGPDALGGFMKRAPHGLLNGELVEQARDKLVDHCLDQVDRGGDTSDWRLLCGIASRGLNDNQRARLSAAVRGSDLFALAHPFEEGSHALWRGAIAPLAWLGDDVSDLVAALSRRCAAMFGSNLADSPGEVALGEIVETAFNASRAGTGSIDEDRLARLFKCIAANWPQAAPQLRILGHRILDATSPTRFSAFWSLVGDLDRLA